MNFNIGPNGTGSQNNSRYSRRELPTNNSQLDNTGPVMILQITLYEMGRKRAIDSGALKPREADLITLRDHAAAMAKETRREIFDPARNPEHKLRQNEYEKLIADRVEIEDAIKHAAAEVRGNEKALAGMPDEAKPGAPILMVAVVAAISLTIAPTIHDFVFSGVEDEVTAWSLSIMSAVFLAAVVVWAILGSLNATGRRTVTNWLGLAAGILISVGLGLFRLSGAMSLEEYVVAMGLTILEVGLVILSEWVASGLRDHFAEWTGTQANRKQAQAQVSAAKAEYERRVAKLEDIDQKIATHIAYVEDLSLRNMNLEQLTESAVKSITDGYNDGLAFNRGNVVKAGGVQ